MGTRPSPPAVLFSPSTARPGIAAETPSSKICYLLLSSNTIGIVTNLTSAEHPTE